MPANRLISQLLHRLLRLALLVIGFIGVALVASAALRA
jgi:hypothetical protein